MPSAIDPTKPADNQPASKADLRANLLAAKTELEHGGFIKHPAPGAVEATVAETLGGFEVNVKTAFGAVGDGAADDTAALQAAIDSGYPLYFPPGDYRITASLTYTGTVMMRGASVKSPPGGTRSRIFGDIPASLIRRFEGFIADDNTFQGQLTGATGLGFVATNMVFENQDVQGCCIQLYNVSTPINIVNCTFLFKRRGLLIIQAFDSSIISCAFISSWWATEPLDETTYRNSIGLYVPGHSAVIGCSFQGCGTAIHAIGNCHITGCRLEVNGYGIRLGGFNLSPETLGENEQALGTVISGCSFEANRRGIWVQNVGGITVSACGFQGSTGAPGGSGSVDISEYAIEIASGSAGDLFDRCTASGIFSRAPIVITGGHANLMALRGSNTFAGRPAVMGGSNTIWSTKNAELYYSAIRVPLNPSVNARLAADLRTATAFSDLQLRGLKGLDVMNANAMPNKLGGMETVAPSATSHAVSWDFGRGSGDAAFSTEPSVVSDAGSTLAPGTYYYAATLIHPRGETGIDYASPGPGNFTYKTATVASGQRVDMTFFGIPAGYEHRLYRGPSPGVFEGYWQFPGSTFSDDGNTAFDGSDMPPGTGIAIPNQHEPDANYAVVATPSWQTEVWITNKATTGFTINFGTPAPAGASVQWLLFRP